MKKNIFIAGGKGFIARNLQEYLNSKFNVFVPSHTELELLDEDKVRKFILANKIQIVINCANKAGGRDTVGMPDVVYLNLRMFFSIVRNLKYLEKIIHLGSGAEYDRRFYYPQMTEEYFDEHMPTDNYGFAKYVCGKYIEKTDKITELRLCGVFGKYENCYFKFISNAIVKNIFKMPIVIAQNVYFDFLYINDLVKMIAHFITVEPKYKAYNVVTGKTIDLVTIAEEINRIGRFQSEIIIQNPGLNIEYSAQNKRLMKETNLKFTPFKKALKELYYWYEQNIDTIDRGKIEKDEYLKYTRVKVQD